MTLLALYLSCTTDSTIELDDSGRAHAGRLTDGDGDGYLDTVDCDDADATVYPSADDDAGDGIDQDCDGADGAGAGGDDTAGGDTGGGDDVSAADADGDGWANATYHGTDCDDLDPGVYPGAPETVGDDVDHDCDGADFGVGGLATGDLVITEIMYDPDAVDDNNGEWFEVYNATAHIVNLEGLVGADDSAFADADIFTVSGTLLATGGDRLVFAISGDPALNGGLTADYDYAGGGLDLSNAADDLHLGVPRGGGHLVIDSVSYDEARGWPISKGVSLELSDAAVDATQNDRVSNWCQATRVAGSNSDKGSPGAASSGC